VCKNYGLLRIQYSVFWGALTQAQARDLAARCDYIANGIPVDVRFIAVCADCFKKSFAIVKNLRLQSQTVVQMDCNPLINILTHTTVGWNQQDRRASSTAAKASINVSLNATAPSINFTQSSKEIIDKPNDIKPNKSNGSLHKKQKPSSKKIINKIQNNTQNVSKSVQRKVIQSIQKILINRIHLISRIGKHKRLNFRYWLNSFKKAQLSKFKMCYSQDSLGTKEKNDEFDKNENYNVSFDIPEDLSQLSFDQILELTGYDPTATPINGIPINENMGVNQKSDSDLENQAQPIITDSIKTHQDDTPKTEGILCRFDEWDSHHGKNSPTEPEFTEDLKIKQESEANFLQKISQFETQTGSDEIPIREEDGNQEKVISEFNTIDTQNDEQKDDKYPMIKTQFHRGAVDIDILLI
jgi:hypothetical protein